MTQNIGTENVYFLDESGFDCSLYNPKGYSIKGTRLASRVFGVRGKRESIISLRDHCHKLVLPEYYNGTAYSVLIFQYLQKIRANLKGKITIILDNAKPHHSKQVKDYCQRNHINLIFLPPYSPDLNPIEKLWGTIKNILRNMNYTKENFRSVLKEVVRNYSLEKC